MSSQTYTREEKIQVYWGLRGLDRELRNMSDEDAMAEIIKIVDAEEAKK